MSAIGLAFLAGVLSILSPCVLPLLPMVLGAAVSEHKWGPAALAGGLTISFTVLGLFVALFGFALGLNADVFRYAAAVLMILIGVVLIVPRFQSRFALAAGPLSNWSENRFGGFSTSGLSGQFGVGLLLGAVWAPCVGPTLGAASVLASRGENLGAVALTMLAFGIGAGLPLLLLGLASREVLLRWRDRLMKGGKALKFAMGVLLIVIGISILTAFDKIVETWLTRNSPDWLTDITTKF